MLLMELGISSSELLGLRWEDFDADTGVLHIRQGLTAYRNPDDQAWILDIQGLKNKYRRRSILIVDGDLRHRLREKPKEITIPPGAASLKVRSLKLSTFSTAWKDCPTDLTTGVTASTMLSWKTWRPSIPTSPSCPRELRYTRTTLWLAQGISPYMVGKLLGHSGTQMLAPVYDHTTVDTLKNVLTGT
ncbi:hypothetical protein [Pseudoflavonifractor sp. HCP28S3_F10]|uniref:hypothetical protein n=1 Tax=Pseudoflavonifractor sp. HCP28S3_F10 TaxID=3438947 RepID=UPI003F88AB73